jgi:serine protease
MHKPLLALVASCAWLRASSPQAQTQAPSSDARVIVKYKTDSPLLSDQALPAAAQRVERAKALGTRVGLELRSGSGVSRRAHVVFAHGLTSTQLAERLFRESDVEYAVPDQRRRISTAPNDPLYLTGPPVSAAAGGPAVGQWYLRTPAGDVQSSINVEPAWDLAPANSDIVVGVIDTGVRFDHPDLQQAAAGGSCCRVRHDQRHPNRQRWRRSRCRRLRPRRLADAGGGDGPP